MKEGNKVLELRAATSSLAGYNGGCDSSGHSLESAGTHPRMVRFAEELFERTHA